MAEGKGDGCIDSRRHDIDVLRVAALLLLIVYHAAISFQRFAPYIAFPQNGELLEWLMIPGSLVNIWRIPILYVISGMALVFSFQRYEVKRVIRQRLIRIGFPLVGGWLVVGPVGFCLSQLFYGKEISYALNPLHLWFLNNIIVYILAGSFLYYFFFQSSHGRINRISRRIFGSIYGLFVTLFFGIAEGFLLNPEVYVWFINGAHGWSIGFICFMLGMLYANSGKKFWRVVSRLRMFTFLTAIVLYLFRLFEYRLEKVPSYLLGIESMLWIWAILGFGHLFLNRDSSLINYLRSAVFPVYILHQPIQYMLAFVIFPLDIFPSLKFLLLVLSVLIVSFGFYQFILRRIEVVKLFFGIR